MARYTCGGDAVPPEGGEREITMECEEAAVFLAGVLGQYCGCPCKHEKDPVCAPNEEAGDRFQHISRTFFGDDYTTFREDGRQLGLGTTRYENPVSGEMEPSLQEMLASTDPAYAEVSFVYRFGYCPDEVPAVYDHLMRDHTLPPPRDPYSCIGEMDEINLDNPSGDWFVLSFDTAYYPEETFRTPFGVSLGYLGCAVNGFCGGGSVEFDYFSTQSEGLFNGTYRESSSVYFLEIDAQVGYFVAFGASAGMLLRVEGGAGVDMWDRELQIRPNEWVGANEYFHMRVRAGLDFMFRPAPWMGILMGAGYSGVFSEDSPLYSHMAEFRTALMFGGDGS